MNNFFKGVILGSITSSLIYIGLALATDRNLERDNNYRTDQGLIESYNKVPDMIQNSTGSCIVNVSRGVPTPQKKCFIDEVMTGIDDNYIYCGRLQVWCND